MEQTTIDRVNWVGVCMALSAVCYLAAAWLGPEWALAIAALAPAAGMLLLSEAIKNDWFGMGTKLPDSFGVRLDITNEDGEKQLLENKEALDYLTNRIQELEEHREFLENGVLGAAMAAFRSGYQHGEGDAEQGLSEEDQRAQEYMEDITQQPTQH